jgi:ribosomal protein L40E
MEEKWRKLREIEAQRSSVIEKLEKIEEKKATVSNEVYNKVKREYDDKLKKIEKNLAEYTDLIKEEINRLRNEEKKLIEQDKNIKLKNEEMELRYSIGEYDDATYKKSSEENKVQLKTIAENLQKVKEQIKWYEDFVEIKGIEESLDVEKETVPKKEAVPKKEETDLQIEEHILEEKPPEGIQLDELLVPEEAVKPEARQKKESPAEETVEAKEEKAVTCPKCGFKNAPDSWYCEKCGAEILGSLPEK